MNAVYKKIEAQKRYCKDNDVPMFASRIGRCYSCSRQIYNKISLERASSELIVSCPYCNRSFCD